MDKAFEKGVSPTYSHLQTVGEGAYGVVWWDLFT